MLSANTTMTCDVLDRPLFATDPSETKEMNFEASNELRGGFQAKEHSHHGHLRPPFLYQSQNQVCVRRGAPEQQSTFQVDRSVDGRRWTRKGLLSKSKATVCHGCFKMMALLCIFRTGWAVTDAMLVSAVVSAATEPSTDSFAHTSSPNSLPLELTWRNLASASLIVLASSAVLAVRWGNTKLAKDIAVACVRCILQLQLIGGLLLTQYLVLSQSHPFLVLLWIIITGILAALESKSRVEHTYPQMTKHLCVALLTGAGLILGAAALTQVFGELRPWFAPRIWIPVSGMLFGNALTACGLGMATWTREFVTRRPSVEWRLCRGASWREALASPLRLSLTAALTPVVNALSVTGLIQLPGMMTGQILAGQSPYQAAAYQVIIFFLIAAFSLVSVQTALYLAVRETVDTANDRLLAPETFAASRKVDRSGNLSESSSFLDHDANDHAESGGGFSTNASWRFDGSLALSSPSHVLRIDNILIERTGARVSIDLCQGDWVGINGPSGVGKSQVLRSVVGLENVDRSSVALRGVSMQHIPMPEWRRRVALVPQDRPNLEATPQQFYDEVREYAIARTQNGTLLDPRSFLREWGSNLKLLDQPWSALSGGEAQIAAIAITLSLQPEVLLLDESTNALDVQSSIRVENTIKNLGIPVLIVSHSPSQLERVCTRVVESSG
jgi:uncharacterized protein (TIGR00245 family)